MNTLWIISMALPWATHQITQGFHFHWILTTWTTIPSLHLLDRSNRTSPSHRVPHPWHTTDPSPTRTTTMSPLRQWPMQTTTPLQVPLINLPSRRLIQCMTPNPSTLDLWMCVIKGTILSELAPATWPARCRINSCTTQPMATPCFPQRRGPTRIQHTLRQTHSDTLLRAQSFQTILCGRLA